MNLLQLELTLTEIPFPASISWQDAATMTAFHSIECELNLSPLVPTCVTVTHSNPVLLLPLLRSPASTIS